MFFWALDLGVTCSGVLGHVVCLGLERNIRVFEAAYIDLNG